MHIDTLSIARDLKEVKLPAAQAEAIAAAIGRSLTDSVVSKGDLEHTRLALKADIDQVRLGLDAKIEQVRANLHTEIERARNQVVVGFVSTQIAFAGLIIAAIKLF